MSQQPTSVGRETFRGRREFLFAAIGSAVGLGNIWRFPYVAYENGGGAFIIPYVIALLSAGIPLLFLDYALGHKYRGSPPLVFRRIFKATEFLGWWQVLICLVISLYYAVIIGWAVSYTYFSIGAVWGDNPADFFMHKHLHTAGEVAVDFQFVAGVLWPLLLVWLITIGIMALGVQKGIARSSKVFIPLLVIMFIILVLRSLFLPGAAAGLDALFTPDWSKLTDASIWVSAYGQIFFSLSVAFGIMLTYTSYLKKDEDLTGSGLIVGFANSSFEILAGIGVFAALGFMAQNAGSAVSEVAASGIGLAFIAFPTIISQAPGGEIIGLLFFGSLVFAGLSSLISLMEVVISAVKDKLGLGRVSSTLMVGLPMMLVSTLLFATTTGLPILDVVDKFVNNFGIVTVALCVVIFLSAGLGALPSLRNHLNTTSSFKLGRTWQIFVGGVTPVVLGYILITEVVSIFQHGYGDYPSWFINTFGWGMFAALIVVSILLGRIPWVKRSAFYDTDIDGFPVAPPILDHQLDYQEIIIRRRSGLYVAVHDGSIEAVISERMED